jgi:hypothetical protein
MPAIDVFWLNHSMTFLPIRGRTNQAQAVLTDPGLLGAMFAVGYSAEHAAAVTRRSLSTPSRDHAKKAGILDGRQGGNARTGASWHRTAYWGRDLC